MLAAALLAVPAAPASAACPASSSSYRSLVLGTGGLTAYWRLDETAGTDACDSRGASTGRYGGGYQLGQPGALTGDANPSVSLNGTTGSVSVPSTLPLSPASSVSLEAWVRPTTLPASQTVVRKDQQYLLRLEGGRLYARVWFVGGSYVEAWSSAVVQAGAWQHLVATFDGATLRVYRNGAQVAASASAGSLQSSSNELTLGRSLDYDHFSGSIDEAAVYSRALPASEVRAHHDHGSGTDTTAPETTVASGPGEASNSSSATFTFASSEPAPTFECRLDGAPWASCDSPKTYTSLKEGRHELEVRARDAAGNVDASPAEYGWVVEPAALYQPATLHSDGAELQWGAFRGTGFSAYEVHRAAAPGFTPTASTLLARIPDRGVTTYRDTTAAAGKAFTYKLLIDGAAGGEHTVTLPADGQAEKTLQPNAANGAATWIRSGSCENYGRSPDLRAGASSGADSTLRSLLSFDLRDVPAGTTVSAATLSLYAYQQPTRPVTYAVHRATASWDEGAGIYSCSGRGASWTNAMPGVSWAAPGGDFASTAETQVAHTGLEGPGWDQFAVKGLVSDWVAGVQPNLGVVVKATDESLVTSSTGVSYRSDDYADEPARRPKLTVTYTDGSRARGPQVDVSSPKAGAAVSGTVDVAVAAADDRRVEQVEVFVDGASIGVDATAPYSRAWNTATAANGGHTLTARATDDAGNATTSPAVAVSVQNSSAPTTAVTSPAATYADTVEADGPAAFWRLGEASGTTAVDASGNNRPATYAGSLLYGQPGLLSGDADTAMLFRNATTDGRATAALSGLLGTQLTAEAWVDYGGGSVAGARNNVLARGSGDGSWLLRVYQSTTGSGEVRALWGLQKGTVRPEAVATISRGRHHLAGTYDGATLRLYVDGKLAASSALDAAAPVTTSSVAVGSLLDDDMKIDDAAVYGRALSAPELKTHAEVGSGGLTGQVTVKASASDDVKVDRVEFYVDETRFAEDTAAPWQATLDTLGLPVFDGRHTLTTKAYDAHGNVTTSAPVPVTVANAGGTKYQATVASTPPPQAMVWDPAASTGQEKAGFDVTITNTSQATWSASDVVARYRWIRGDGTVAGSWPEVSLGSDLAPGASRTLNAVLVDPPALPDGVDRAEHELRFDLYEKSTARWFEARGNKPLQHRVTVVRKRPVGLGLERYHHYDGAELGAGMQHVVNLASGNSLVRWTPFATPGRGLSTVVSLTYNSLEQHSTSPAGNNVSLSVSSLTRFGTQLDVHPNKADEIAGRANRYVELVDGDGTTHRFTGRQAADGSVYWTEPNGVHLWLRRYSTTDPARTWALTRPDRVTHFFDADGYPTSVVDRNGNALRFTVVDTPPGEDPGGPKKRITEITDAGGRKFTVAYYGKADGPKGRVRGKIRRIADHDGSALDFDYYDDGNLRRLTQAGGTNADGSPLPGRSFTFTYTEPSSSAQAANTAAQSSRIYSVRDPLGRETVFTYLDAGAGADRYKLVARKDRAGKTTSYAYDSTTRTTTLTEPQSATATRTSKFQFDAEGKATRLTNARDEVTTVDWTADRHVAKVTPPSNGTEQRYVEFRYDDNGYLTDQWDELRRHTVLQYDHPAAGAGDPGGNADVAEKWATGRTHGHLSDLVKKTDPAGTASMTGGDFEWTFVNDGRGNVKSVTDPEQKSTSYEYDQASGDLVRTTDANGNVTLLESYDPSGQPGKVRAIGKSESADDRVTQFGYDADGLLRWVQSPLHASLSGGDPAEYRTYFHYDAFHRMGRQSAPKSYAHERGLLLYSDAEFDANDNLKARVAPHEGPNPAAGSRTTFDYDAMDRRTAVNAPPDRAGAAIERTEVEYDEAGRVRKVTRPRGVADTSSGLDHARFYGYDELDRVIRTTRYDMAGSSPTALVERRCYDTAGDLISITAPKASPDALSCPVSSTTPYTRRLTYFPDHRLKSSSDPLGRTVSFTYDENGDEETSTDPGGKVTRRFYDQRRKLIRREEPFSATRTVTTAFKYDAVGNLEQKISPRAWDASPDKQSFDDFATRYEYNDFGEVARVVLPTGGGTDQAYVYRDYDAAGRMTSVSLPTTETAAPTGDDERTALTYYDTGWLRTSRHPGDPEVLFDYTAEGWQSKRVPQLPGGGQDVARRVLRSYFPDGLLAQETDRRGQITQFSYDLNDNLTGAVDSNGIVQKGQVPVEIAADYDSLDRPKTVRSRRPKDASDTDWRITSYEAYDADGNVEDVVENRVERADGTQVAPGRKLHYAYDQADRVTSTIDYGRDSSSGATADDRKVEVAYTPTGSLESRSIAKGTGFADTLQTTAWEYFDNGLRRAVKTRNGAGTEVESDTLDYLEGDVFLNGHRVKDTFTLRGPKAEAPCDDAACTTTWKYDARDRLLEESRQRTTTRKTEYTLDAAGNVELVKRDGTVTSDPEYVGNRLDFERDSSGDVTARYFYDGAGRLRCRTEERATKADCDNYSGDAPFAGLLEYYAYDHQDRLLAQKAFDGTGRARRETSYDYDALDRVVKQVERHGSGGTSRGSRTTQLTYLGLTKKVTQEKQDPLSSTGKQHVKSYGYDPFGERIGMNDRVPASGTDPEKSSDYTYATDAHGSVSLLLDDAGKAQAAYGYTAYGESDKAEQGSDRLTHELDASGAETPDEDPLNPYRYSSNRLDTGAGTIDMGARHFAPSTGHFLQEDFYEDGLADLDLSTDELTANRYALAGGNPISFVELDGHEPVEGSYVNAPTDYYGKSSMSRAARKRAARVAERLRNHTRQEAGVSTPDAGDRNSMTVEREIAVTSAANLSARQSAARVAERREKEKGSGALGIVHTGLDVAGLVPVVGEAADVANAGIYAAEGNEAMAALSLGAAVPIAGWGATGTKVGIRAADAAGGSATATRTFCSFSGETQVTMADGSSKPISRVRAGDRVLATDPGTGERSARRVTRVWVHSDRMIRLQVAGQTLVTTADHPFWNAATGQWTAAGALDAGDLVAASDGRLVGVDGVSFTGAYTATAYNLTVQGVHTYHVGPRGVLVHNTCNGPGGSMDLPEVPKPPTGPGSVAKADRDPRRLYSRSQVQRGLDKQGGVCAICREPIDDLADARGHHIDRHADGGLTDDGNLAVLCPECHADIHRRR
ncbi:MAG TPA: LamG-like jellyroll fold domain-containing protein [Frankiaceae bacterium]|nr:LamG-like jellyroll fold domain-containing protein [Frankiaceae bacterium]